jgi:hypothetical protein
MPSGHPKTMKMIEIFGGGHEETKNTKRRLLHPAFGQALFVGFVTFVFGALRNPR